MKIVKDWKNAWRWVSVHALIVTGLLPTAWASIPAAWQAAVPLKWLALAAVTTGSLGLLGRLLDQTKTPTTPSAPPTVPPPVAAEPPDPQP